jgi:NAD(P)-dependent dehydrogenase (short-subunit alcohol dehydrogenase family)
MPRRLEGRVAVVTGAAGDGMGRAIALAFAAEGAAVGIVDIRPPQPTVDLVRARGGDVSGTTADMADAGSVGAALANVRERLGPIDVLVNNAGTTDRRPFLEITLDDWDRVHGVNLRGYFIAAQWVARSLVARREAGCIINIASISATHVSGNANYCASKGGVLMLTRCMAVELAPHAIRVNAISPGTFETDFNRHVLADAPFRATKLAPIRLGRFGAPTDVAGMAVLLASDEASYVTGANMVIDGGHTA